MGWKTVTCHSLLAPENTAKLWMEQTVIYSVLFALKCRSFHCSFVLQATKTGRGQVTV